MTDFETRLHAMILGARTDRERNLLLNVRNLYDAYVLGATHPAAPAITLGIDAIAKDWSNLPANEMTAHRGMIVGLPSPDADLLTERSEHSETLRKLSRLIEERDLWIQTAEQQRVRAEKAEHLATSQLAETTACEKEIIRLQDEFETMESERDTWRELANNAETRLLNLRGASINDLITFGNSNVAELERRVLELESKLK